MSAADDADAGSLRRRDWPAMRAPDWRVMERIAAAAGVSFAAVLLLRSHGFLWAGLWRGRDAFFIRHGAYCQARRLDGHPFDADGWALKAWTLPGSEAGFLCPGGLGGDDVPVLIAGTVGRFLEAVESILTAETPVAVLAATSDSARLDAGLLAGLRGRRVSILADPDTRGLNAAFAWAGQLTAAGCHVHITASPLTPSTIS